MLVPVVHVGIMGMLVRNRLVNMPVIVRSGGFVVAAMGMPMMLVVDVGMAVLQAIMVVLVLVALRQVQPHAQGHERRRDPE